jgi:hypothetical protein
MLSVLLQANTERFKNNFTVVNPNDTVWRVLPKILHLKAYELSIVQHLELDIPITINRHIGVRGTRVLKALC